MTPRKELALWGTALAAAIAVSIGIAFVLGTQFKQHTERVIPIDVRRFEYTPNQITIKKGTPVILELKSLDVPHGFNLPDMGVRADVLPGMVARVRFIPTQTGRFVFHCDIFCGTGHEELEGAIIVES